MHALTYAVPVPGFQRRLPIGAELLPAGGAHFRVWAPNASTVALVFDKQTEADAAPPTALTAEGNGYFSGTAHHARAGMTYRFQLNHGAFPDPASRFQPSGPHGPSQVVDPGAFTWSDDAWPGVDPQGQILYELHLGTFTPEGTWAAAAAQLPELAHLGVTLLEIMPVADFPGTRGWGYDGVNLFAPCRLYGQPDDMRRFVDEAHQLGMGVILDVVYNHLGPDGNYLPQYSKDYFHKSKVSEWGDTLNFDDEHSGPVRELFCANAAHWISEYHLDGLRLDAVHQIFDESQEHFLQELTRRARAAAGTRRIFIVAENELQQGHLARSPEAGGYGLDAAWSDDFHHSAMVALTGRDEQFFADYKGSAQEMISCAKWGFLYQGQHSRWMARSRGTSAFDLAPWNFVVFLQNHDQAANPAWGRRLHTIVSPARLRAITAWLMLGPNTPLLFQGQEFAASAPFYYFSDLNHDPALARAITQGRQNQLEPFLRFANPGFQHDAIDPQREETHLACKLDLRERELHAPVYELHRDLIHLRRQDPVVGRCPRTRFDASVLGGKAMALRYFDPVNGDRLLLVNLESNPLELPPDPLLAAPSGWAWELVWTSEDPKYGGFGPGADPAVSPQLLTQITADSAWWLKAAASI